MKIVLLRERINELMPLRVVVDNYSVFYIMVTVCVAKKLFFALVLFILRVVYNLKPQFFVLWGNELFPNSVSDFV